LILAFIFLQKMNSKVELRQHYKALRQGLSSTEIDVYSKEIGKQLMLHFDLSLLGCLHIFLSITKHKEIDTLPLIETLQDRYPNLRLVTSWIDPVKDELQTLELLSGIPVVEGRWGIPEPAVRIPFEDKRIDMILVPLLAFDEAGHRIGYGKGYYDRFLKRCPDSVIKVGVSLFPPVKVIEGITPQDIALNYCITPQRLYAF
jgi:5-formyltetrahydrofolate cyclo-ligase